MRHEWTDRNPIRLVRQSAKRLSTPDCLTAEEIGKLLRNGVNEIHLTRAIVCQHVGPLKTAASQKPVPMDAGLAALPLDWRKKCLYNQRDGLCLCVR